MAAGFSKFLADRSNEHLRGELAAELEKTRHILEIESRTIQSLLDRRQLVSRARFEAELSAMKDVHAGVTNVQMWLRSCRPTLDTAPRNETEDERHRRLLVRASSLSEAHDNAAQSVEALRPFYIESLYEHLSRCLGAARLEIHQVQTEEWNRYDFARENLATFEAAYKEVLAMIRVRMNQLSVTE